jgi:hypothetical protein
MIVRPVRVVVAPWLKNAVVMPDASMVVAMIAMAEGHEQRPLRSSTKQTVCFVEGICKMRMGCDI